MNNSSIYPCLWFDNQGKTAADFYIQVFDDGRNLEHTPLVTTFSVENVRFMALNGGPYFQVNPAISYYVYCGSDKKLNHLYQTLKEGGSVLMELGRYSWSERYAWVSDKFGVNWQLDIGDADSKQKIVPCMLFANEKKLQVKAARDWYISIFPESSVLLESPYPAEQGFPDGTLLFTQFNLRGRVFNAMSSSIPHEFDFTEGNSFVVECETQDEIDRYWESLTEGGQESMCGWLKDKFGVSWQIVPSRIGELMRDKERGAAVSQALMKMKKIDIQILESAGGRSEQL